MRWRLRNACIAAGFVTITASLHAQTLEAGNAQAGSISNSKGMTGSQTAVAFESDQDFTATSASIWAVYMPGGVLDSQQNDPYAQRQFGWAIYSDHNDLPGSLVASGESMGSRTYPTDEQMANGGNNVVSQWSIPLNATLSGNTRYWLALADEDSTVLPGHAEIYWEADNGFGLSSGFPPSAGGSPEIGWTPLPASDEAAVGYGNRLTLAVYGDPTTTTPEPGTLVLLGTGLAGLVPIVRRRRAVSR